MSADREALRRELAEALTDDVLVPIERGPVLDALLPLVERAIAAARAEALAPVFTVAKELNGFGLARDRQNDDEDDALAGSAAAYLRSAHLIRAAAVAAASETDGAR